MAKRYRIINDSQSAHCCFSHTIVDSAKPEMMHGVPYVKDGVPQFEEVCECLDETSAQLVCSALNASTWMSATDSLPSQKGETLCFGPGLGFMVAEYEPYPGGGGSWLNEGEVWFPVTDVTHWMLLSDPRQ